MMCCRDPAGQPTDRIHLAMYGCADSVQFPLQIEMHRNSLHRKEGGASGWETRAADNWQAEDTEADHCSGPSLQTSAPLRQFPSCCWLSSASRGVRLDQSPPTAVIDNCRHPPISLLSWLIMPANGTTRHSPSLASVCTWMIPFIAAIGTRRTAHKYRAPATPKRIDPCGKA